MAFSPQKFGKYILLDKIASGGMAEIFMAQTMGPGGFEKIVALKRILPTFSSSPEFISMFIDEAKITSQLSHSNIVQIYEFGEIDATYYLAMEFVDGKNLRQILARTEELRRNIPIEHCVHMVSKICMGLDSAHRFRDKRGGQALHIIHRDISPQNILISYEGEVKLIDFGIAKTRSQGGKTKSGVLKGKFGYMSPEQAKGEAIDQRSDIFSTGIILFEMLTRQRLFSSNNDLNTLKKIQDAKIPAPSHFNPDIPFELEEIVLKALQKDPKLRYQTAHDFHKDLSRFLNTINPDFTSAHTSSFVRSLFAMELIEHKKQVHEALVKASQFDVVKPLHETPPPPKTQLSEISTVTKANRQTQTSRSVPKTKTEHHLDREDNQYRNRVRLQIMVLGMSIIFLSTLLIYFNKNPNRMIQSILDMKEPPPAFEKGEVPITRGQRLKDAVEAVGKEVSLLRVDTTPQGADVYINHELQGQTPLSIPRQPQNQKLHLQIKKKGFETIEETLILNEPHFNFNKPLVMLGIGLLNITTTPPSEIYIDHESIGQTPILKRELTAGVHKIKAINTEFNLSAETQIEIKADEMHMLDENDLIFKPIQE